MSVELQILIFIIICVSILLLVQFLIGVLLLFSEYISKETFKIVNCCWLIGGAVSVVILYLINYIIFKVMGA